MIGYLVLGSGVLLSAIGAYMSIVGLSSIFGGAIIAVVIMGVILELAKTTTAVYLKVLWGSQRLVIRSYFIIATIILSLVTSLGIFGFLSRSYSVDTIEYGSNKVLIESLEKQVQLEKNRISSLEKQLEKFAVPPRRITQQIDESTNSLIELEKKLSTEKQTSEKYGAELLPLVFISELLFGSADPTVAVKLLIVLLVITMDPLALLLTTVGVSMVRTNKTFVFKSETLEENDVYEIKMTNIV
jgi:hypothetical protein